MHEVLTAPASCSRCSRVRDKRRKVSCGGMAVGRQMYGRLSGVGNTDLSLRCSKEVSCDSAAANASPSPSSSQYLSSSCFTVGISPAADPSTPWNPPPGSSCTSMFLTFRLRTLVRVGGRWRRLNCLQARNERQSALRVMLSTCWPCCFRYSSTLSTCWCVLILSTAMLLSTIAAAWRSLLWALAALSSVTVSPWGSQHCSTVSSRAFGSCGSRQGSPGISTAAILLLQVSSAVHGSSGIKQLQNNCCFQVIVALRPTFASDMIDQRKKQLRLFVSAEYRHLKRPRLYVVSCS